MAGFYLTGVTDTSVVFHVQPTPEFNDYYLYVRLANDTSDTSFGEWHSLDPTGGERTFVAGGLTPGTAYKANVACNTTPTLSGATWLTGESFETDSAPPTPTGKIVEISDGRAWFEYRATVWNGSTWVPIDHTFPGG